MATGKRVDPNLSIIIVSFNTKELLTKCLTPLMSFLEVEGGTWEVIVVDNASTDGSQTLARHFGKGLTWIQNKENVGFTRANNMGLKKARGNVFLLLNSDTVATPEAITSTYTYLLSQPSVGVITCRVELPDGSLDPACHRGFPTPWAALTYMSGLEKLFQRSRAFSQYHLGYQDTATIHDIDSPSGAFFMIRRSVTEDVGLLDETYFMYGEDLDWSYRIKQKGWHIIFYPFAKILHTKKQSGLGSSDPERRKQTKKYFYETMKLFYDLHYASRYPRILTWGIQTVLSIRLFVASL